MALKNSIMEFNAYLGSNESLLDANYPRISKMIKLHWGYKELYLYINKLLHADRNPNRQGFPLEVIHEIHQLQEIHEKLFPGLETLRNDSLMDISRGKKKQPIPI